MSAYSQKRTLGSIALAIALADLSGCAGPTSPVCDREECAELAVETRHTPGLFERSYPVVGLSLAGRPLPGLGSLAGLPAKPNFLGKLAALFGIFRSHHRIILRQAPFYSIVLR